MIRSKQLIPFACLCATLLVGGCGQHNTNAKGAPIDSTGGPANRVDSLPSDPPGADQSVADSAAIMQAFEQLKQDNGFLKELGLMNETEFNWNNDYHTIIRGDLDGDGVSDALFSFVIESRGGGNNGDMHYAVLLNQHQGWKYQTQLDAGGDWAVRFIQLDTIENGIILGNLVGNKDRSLPDVAVEYVFVNGNLVNTFTALFQDEGNARDFLWVQEIIAPDYTVIPTVAILADYQALLGKGKIVEPEEQPECGTHFDEGVYSELHYPNLVIELNNGQEAACDLVTLKGSGFRINTGKGTLTGNTTLQEIEAIFDKNSSLWINEEADGRKTLVVSDGDGSDDQLHIRFDEDDTIISVKFFVQC